MPNSKSLVLAGSGINNDFSGALRVISGQSSWGTGGINAPTINIGVAVNAGAATIPATGTTYGGVYIAVDNPSDTLSLNASLTGASALDKSGPVALG